MGMLVDYRCHACGCVNQSWVSSPPPPERECTVCAQVARRVFSSVGVVGRARQRSSEPRVATSGSLCRTNQDIPGLCMFSPTAQRALVARVRRDNRALDAELAYQEHAQKEAPGTLTVGGHGCSGHAQHEASDHSSDSAAAAPALPSTPPSPPTDPPARST